MLTQGSQSGSVGDLQSLETLAASHPMKKRYKGNVCTEKRCGRTATGSNLRKWKVATHEQGFPQEWLLCNECIREDFYGLCGKSYAQWTKQGPGALREEQKSLERQRRLQRFAALAALGSGEDLAAVAATSSTEEAGAIVSAAPAEARVASGIPTVWQTICQTSEKTPPPSEWYLPACAESSDRMRTLASPTLKEMDTTTDSKLLSTRPIEISNLKGDMSEPLLALRAEGRETNHIEFQMNGASCGNIGVNAHGGLTVRPWLWDFQTIRYICIRWRHYCCKVTCNWGRG